MTCQCASPPFEEDAEDLIHDADVSLQLDALPVLCQLFASSLFSERSVAVDPVARKQGAEARLVTRFPRCFIAPHEPLDIHSDLSRFLRRLTY